MKALFLSILLFTFIVVDAQYVGPPRNVGREYGNPKMPLMVSHLAGANKERLKRANENSRHSIFGKILCFRKLCRIQSGHPSSLRDLGKKKFDRRVTRNAKKGLYKRTQIDSTFKLERTPSKVRPVIDTSAATPSVPILKSDSLIVLAAELLFETDRSTLRREHFKTLNSIVEYLVSHPDRSVKISGHTDNIGSEQHNVALSKRRADVVAEYLVTNGIDQQRVKSSGFGSAKPIVQNTTDEARQKNRRVELLIYSGH
jgi:outer membrane protein OmpA-like peptidoglycan-associated protein